MKLGSFGAAVREFDPASERDTFDFFDREFTVHGVIPPMLMLQLGAAMTGKVSEVEGNAAMWEALRCALTTPGDEDAGRRPDDAQFDAFYRLAVDRRCTTDELIKLVFALLGVQADLPTEQPPASQDGRLPTTGSSNSSASNTPDSPRLRPVDEVLAG
jgi:hypothetical protein